MIIYRGVVLSTTILKGKGKESKERKKVFTFHFDFRGKNMFFFFYSMQETITFFECLASLLAEKREQWSSKLDCVTNNSKTKKYTNKNHSFHFFSYFTDQKMSSSSWLKVEFSAAGRLFISYRPIWRKREVLKRKQSNVIMNGCHLVLGRSRIDRWYITTFESGLIEPINLHSIGTIQAVGLLTQTVPFSFYDNNKPSRRFSFFFFFFLFVGKKTIRWATQRKEFKNWNNKEKKLAHESLRWCLFVLAVVIHQRGKGIPFFSKLTAINGTDWKLADGCHQKNQISPPKKIENEKYFVPIWNSSRAEM